MNWWIEQTKETKRNNNNFKSNNHHVLYDQTEKKNSSKTKTKSQIKSSQFLVSCQLIFVFHKKKKCFCLKLYLAAH
jgi:hypothetical protein